MGSPSVTQLHQIEASGNFWRRAVAHVTYNNDLCLSTDINQNRMARGLSVLAHITPSDQVLGPHKLIVSLQVSLLGDFSCPGAMDLLLQDNCIGLRVWNSYMLKQKDSHSQKETKVALQRARKGTWASLRLWKKIWSQCLLKCGGPKLAISDVGLSVPRRPLFVAWIKPLRHKT